MNYEVKSSSYLTSQTEIEKWMEDYTSRYGKNVAHMRRIFLSLSEEIPVKETDEYGKNFKPSEDIHPVQRWFKCREGFSVNLIKEILRRNLPQRKVLDPFCGSGTTLVGSNELGIKAVGFDVNPLVTFVSKVKTTMYSKEDIEKLSRAVSDILCIINTSKRADIPKLRVIDKAFNVEILNTLLKLKYKIEEIHEQKIHDFLKLGWVAVLETVSNTRKEGNGIKYRFTKRTGRGYISLPQQEWEDNYFGKQKSKFVIKKLKLKYDEMLSDLQELSYVSLEPTVHNESALELTNFLERGTVSMVLFSPPYANSFDYFEIFKIELWMGDFVKNYVDLRSLRNRALRSNINTNLDISRGDLDLPELDELVSLMRDERLWDRKLKKMVFGYFQDMNVVLKEIYQVTESGGKCIVIVGNSAYADILIPTDLLLSKIARGIGFQNLEIQVGRHLTTSSQQRKKLIGLKEYLRESIIFMEKE